MSENVDRLMANRHELSLQWSEPWQAIGPTGSAYTANVIMTAMVDDCINIQRHAKDYNLRGTEDADILIDFIAIHWASPDERRAP